MLPVCRLQQARDVPYNEDAIAQVLERISQGTSVRAATRDSEISAITFRLWVIDDLHGLAARYARARELQFEAWADEIKELADVVQIGTRTKEDAEGNVETWTGDMIERAKLQIDARKWLLGKLHPKKYGDTSQTEVTVGGTGRPITIEIDPNKNHRRLMGSNGHTVDVEANGHTNGNGTNGHGEG